jgi:hypothetical protein
MFRAINVTARADGIGVQTRAAQPSKRHPMSNHTPTSDGVLYICPACAWRAVEATDGRIVMTAPGDPGHDHIGQARRQQAARIAHAQQIMERLRQHYAQRTPLPIRPGQKWPALLTAQQLERLERAVVGEWR